MPSVAVLMLGAFGGIRTSDWTYAHPVRI